jgi:hypothetical protein
VDGSFAGRDDSAVWRAESMTNNTKSPQKFKTFRSGRPVPHQLPEDFDLTEERLAVARSCGLSDEQAVGLMGMFVCNKCCGPESSDWDKAWQRHCRKWSGIFREIRYYCLEDGLNPPLPRFWSAPLKAEPADRTYADLYEEVGQ